ncbi:MAG TPA: SDR family NAD(P)-dependent oxidoreductase [Actinophytocola sp.]|uniref:SDR family NAD(P)-dependent oxidoreductase n=1 Tax=Actinophytocola sp. TaxID=1872138 RepID=UPI002DBE3028|nr:SDR family NAD(P)-dependent oxidoreductase [Actinophytocola sp.]HEU5469846.1 SDR family NAD(P)-dependent oxidoreductase [Actinophytocola sp.]
MNNATERPLAIVTGASSGIGYELAKQFASNGFDLVVAAEDARITDVAMDFQALGARVGAVRADLTTAEGVELVFSRAAKTGRPVNAVAINAGVGVGGPFAETSLEADLGVVDLNVRSSVHLAKLAVRDMVRHGAGRILITSSIAATQPGPFEATYAASKAFLLSFAEALRAELKDRGITVTALMPGPTDTEFFERAGLEDTKLGAAKKDDPAQVAKEGFEALMRGKDHVVTGSLKNKLMAGAAKVLPEAVKAQAHRRMSEPGSAQG